MSKPIGAIVIGLFALSTFAQAQPTRQSVSLPVDHVTVFGDRARVTRTGRVTVPKSGELVLPLLPVTVEPASIRVDGRGLSVSRVSVRRVQKAELPESEARTLLDALEQASRELRAVEQRIATIEEARRFVQSLQPKASPVEGALPEVFTLAPGGWAASLAFIDARATKLATAVSPVKAERLAKIEEINALRARIEQLLANATGRPGYEVVAEVEGAREGSLELVYVAANARWFPSYDVRFDPDAQQVSLALGALVSQETGEDWTDAKLTLSTAIPATTATLPKLAVWKIGDRERFIPTPQPLPQPRPPVPQPWRPQPRVDSKEQNELRQALQASLSRTQLQPSQTRMSRARPMSNAGLSSMGGVGAMPERAAPPPAAPRTRSYNDIQMSSESISGSFKRQSKPSESVSFSAPGGWRPPRLPGDSPAALAGGHAFTYDAARRETVTSGTRDAQVSLATVTLPAKGVVKILPALSSEAFLVTELTNTTGRPLFTGDASLFVGADLVGQAKVPTTAKGAKVTLPLGIDDAIQVERHVTVLQSEKGVFAKDDVTKYEVEIELLNPRSKAVRAVVVEQVPLEKGEDVKITLESATPALSQKPDADGLIKWELELPRGAKKVLKFRYSVVRPKDWKLWQQSQPKGGR